MVQHCLLLKVNWISEDCKKIEAEDSVGDDDDDDDDDDGNIEKDKTKVNNANSVSIFMIKTLSANVVAHLVRVIMVVRVVRVV